MTLHLLYYSPEEVRIFKYRTANVSELQVASEEWKVNGVNTSTDVEEYQLILYDERYSKPRKLDQYALLIIVRLFLQRSPAYYVRNIIIPTYTISVVRLIPCFVISSGLNKYARRFDIYVVGERFCFDIIYRLIPYKIIGIRWFRKLGGGMVKRNNFNGLQKLGRGHVPLVPIPPDAYVKKKGN